MGYDANALYLWALTQDMPTGSYTRCLAENEFKPKGSIQMANEWLEFVAQKAFISVTSSTTRRSILVAEDFLTTDLTPRHRWSISFMAVSGTVTTVFLTEEKKLTRNQW